MYVCTIHPCTALPQVINETLAGMQGLVEGMSSAVNGQLDWVVSQLGGANHGLRSGRGGDPQY